MKTMSKLLVLLLLLTLAIPAQAAAGKYQQMDGEPPLQQALESTKQIRLLAKPEALKHPSKTEIIAKSKTVTSSQTIFLTEPSVVAPYATGSLTEEFMQTGLTYLNYVRFVAGLPEITLDDAMNLDAQHGAVVLAAIDELTHYPHKPADMDDAFFKRGSDATSSSNISYRWGYNPLGNLKNSILGCMNDNSSIGNLTTVGHRRWLLNPTLGKVGFGYAESNSGASYIVTKVFDWSGVGCTFDFISWPAAGNQPVDLFPTQNPWSVTLNNSVYQKASADSVKITVTRESDGTQWTFDGSTGQPNTAITPYLVVNNQGYGIPNCIIFHPGTANVRSYEGVYTVKITGIFYKDGSAAEINYTVDFFDINSYCPDHNYTPTVTAPTCTEQGYTTYTCSSCGDSYVSDYVASLGHAMGKWYITKEATCTENGAQRRDCSRCGHYETQVITSDGHRYTTKVTAPTCTEQGYTTHTCHCGDSYIDDYVSSLGHAMGSWYTTKEVTCTRDGEQRRDCSRCDHYETQVITSDGHSYSKKVTAPTCTEQGYTTYTCQCGGSYVSDYVASLGHDMGKWYITKEATCTENGAQRRDCSRCGHYETQVITSAGHSYSKKVTAPTCTEQGYTTYTCSVCSYSHVNDYLPSRGHAMGDWYTTKESTCYENGTKRRDCSRCDHFETRSIPSGHSYIPTVTAPTCTEQGYTTYTCSVCSYSHVNDYLPSRGHAMGNWYITKEATCTNDGEQRKDCSRCDHFETDVITSNGHSYSKKVTSPTCTEQGYTTYTCHCGDSYISNYVTSLGHAMGNWYTTKEATCTENGAQRRDCSRCDHYETQVITSNGHSYSKKVTAPTCTEQGYTTYTCSCGDSYVSDYVASLGHDMGKWYITKEATCTNDGEQRRDCSRCDHYETQVITSSGHQYGDDTVCDNCGFDSTAPEYPENALMLSGEEFADQDTVWIEGLPYPIQGEGSDRYVELPTEDDCYMVTYTYHTGDAADVHTQYPTGMKVYKVSDGEITHIPELDNLLQYSGASIRITGKKGIRMITSLTKTNKTALTGKGLAGFKLLEYGTALCFAHEIPQGDALVLGRDFTRSNYAYKKGVADPVFASTKDLIQYTNVLVGFSLDQCKDDIAMRPYIILEDAAGNQITLYGGTIYRSIGYIAYQNRTVFKPKTASYNYVWELIHHVYGDKYDADYKG